MVKIGVLLPTREAVMYAGDGDPRPLVDLARGAEALGYDSVWAGDSLLAKPRAEPLTLLAGVASIRQMSILTSLICRRVVGQYCLALRPGRQQTSFV